MKDKVLLTNSEIHIPLLRSLEKKIKKNFEPSLCFR